jgi:hypothetical protein
MPLDNIDDVSALLGYLRGRCADELIAVLLSRDPATQVDVAHGSTSVEPSLESELLLCGAADQAAALTNRMRNSGLFDRQLRPGLAFRANSDRISRYRSSGSTTCNPRFLGNGVTWTEAGPGVAAFVHSQPPESHSLWRSWCIDGAVQCSAAWRVVVTTRRRDAALRGTTTT